MKLYFAPNTCALSPHIVLRELGIDFELEQVDLATKKTKSGEDYKAVNPKGYVPALVLDDGTLLTEGAIIVQVLADRHPSKGLAPPAGTIERIRLQEWLHFIATELHKGLSPLYNAKANEELKTSIKERLELRLGVVEKHLEDRPYIMGAEFSVADPYLFYCLRSWQRLTRHDLSQRPALNRYFERIRERQSVQAALTAEGTK